MLKKSTSWSILIYGILIVGLGVLGYQQAASRVSLYSGVGCGSLLILSAILMFNKKKSGAYLAVLITTLLTATFGIRYSTTGNNVPALMAVLSGGMLLFLLAKTARWRHPQ